MNDSADSNYRAKVGRNAGIIGIGVNILLFMIKLTAGILSGSVSIIADAVNNLSDAASSVISLIGFKMAEKPAARLTRGHRGLTLSRLPVAVRQVPQLLRSV